MKRLSLITFILTSITMGAMAFDHQSYPNVPFDDIMAYIQPDIEANKDVPGQTQFGEKVRFLVTLQEYPERITNSRKPTIFNLAFSIFPEEFLQIFEYEMAVEIDGQRCLFLFQGPLMKYLPNEVQVGSDFEVFALIGIHDNIEDELTFLVNEYNANPALFGR